MNYAFSDNGITDTILLTGETGSEVKLLLREIRREHTGLHGLAAVAQDGKVLAHDTFNIGRAAERRRLAKDAHGSLTRMAQELLPLEGLQHRLDILCLYALTDWEQDRFTIQDIDTTAPLPPRRFFLSPHIEEGTGTIVFAPPGAGKSWFLLMAAADLNSGQSRVWQDVTGTPALYVDLERSAIHFQRRASQLALALGRKLPTLPYLKARGLGLPALARKIRSWSKSSPGGIVLYDSISRVGMGSLKEDDTANAIIDMANAASETWIALAHSPRGDDTHAFGCHSEDTEVLTQAGWKFHGDVRLDDLVGCYEPETHTWRWEHPTHLHAYPYTGEMVHLDGKSVDALLTPSHRLLVKRRTRAAGVCNVLPSSWAWDTAGSLKQNQLLPCAAINFGGESPLTFRIGPANFEARGFVRYLGWWLSEGSISRAAANLTQADGELAKRMLAQVRALGFDPRLSVVHPKPRPGYSQEKTIWHISTRRVPWFARWLTEHCGKGAASKRMPEFIAGLAPHLRTILLDAMMEGDGSYAKGRPGSGTYSTISIQLANDFQALALSLGVGCTVSRYLPTRDRESVKYAVNLRRSQTVGITATHGNIKQVPYSGNVYCLTVPTGAYWTRRNGKAIITGNSMHFDAGADTVIRLTSEKRGQFLGCCLRVTKSNHLGDTPLLLYTLGFNLAGLTTIATASPNDWAELSSKGEKATITSAIFSFLQSHPNATCDTLAVFTGETPSKVYYILTHDPLFAQDGRQGKADLWKNKDSLPST